ncbi:AAA family ATPase, partial [Parabacteroides goldsteinii]
MLIKTGLYVITGGPGTGKTSLIEELKIVGYQTVKEVARDIIKEQ